MEKENAERCARNFCGNDFLYVPKVYGDLTSTQILTMEFIDGVKSNDIVGLERLGVSSSWVGRNVFSLLAQQVMKEGWWLHCHTLVASSNYLTRML